MKEDLYRTLFDRAQPSQTLIENTLADAQANRRPRRRHVLPRRAAAAVLCFALVLAAANYQAVAAGFRLVVSYFSGVGAASGPVMVAEPTSWTQGDRLYQLDGVSQGDYLLLEVYGVSPEQMPVAALATWQLQVWDGSQVVEHGDANFSEWQPYNRIVVQGQPWKPLEESQSGPGVAWAEQGYRSMVHMSFTYRLPDGPTDTLTFTLTDEDTDLPLHSGTLQLSAVEETAAVADNRDFAEGRVTALVRQDGRQLSVYAHQQDNGAGITLLGASPIHGQITFIGASGKRYTDSGEGYRSFVSSKVCLVLASLPSWVEEPIVAVEIGAIYLYYQQGVYEEDSQTFSGYGQGSATYDNLNWVIPLS